MVRIFRFIGWERTCRHAPKTKSGKKRKIASESEATIGAGTHKYTCVRWLLLHGFTRANWSLSPHRVAASWRNDVVDAAATVIESRQFSLVFEAALVRLDFLLDINANMFALRIFVTLK